MILAHYTSIGTLKLILENQTIRFSRLDLLDDYHEISLYASQDVARQVFVSCWSDAEDEIIPQWSMYGNDKCGVRIILDSSYIRLPEPTHSTPDNHLVQSSLMDPAPQKVQYFKDEELINRLQEVVQVNCSGGVNIYGHLGIYKSDYWCFQKEYRLILTMTKFHLDLVKDQPVAPQIVPDYNYVDVRLSSDFLNNIQVMLGPLCNEESQVLSLLKQYGVKQELLKSKLTGVLKMREAASHGICIP